MTKLNAFTLIILASMLISCANQLPPPGGEDDRIAPRILYIDPAPGTKNFRGNEVRMEFDEYIDKRSFIDALKIYPKPETFPEIDWSGTEVTLTFPKSLQKNTTYVVTLGKDLKDLRGGNALTLPVVSAFSTGNKIDTGMISGKVFAEKTDRIRILLYNITEKKNPDPATDKADYVIEPSEDGTFTIPFLPDSRYRVFSIYDEDRNSMYGEEFEQLAIPSDDIAINSGSKIKDVQLFLSDPITDPASSTFLKSLTSDSLGKIFSNLPESGQALNQRSRLYFHFINIASSKQDVVSGFSLTDSASGRQYKPVFNWLNDSLLEVTAIEKFDGGTVVTAKLDLRSGEDDIDFVRNFSVSEKQETSQVSGKVKSEQDPAEIRLALVPLEKSLGTIKATLNEDGSFMFRNLPEGKYTLIAFDDRNGNGFPDRGNLRPFRYSEKMIIFDKEIDVKENWNVDGIELEF